MVVKFLLVLVIYFGFVIQQYVIVELVWPTMRQRLAAQAKWLARSSNDLALEMSFRAALVLLSSELLYKKTN
jgi:hypothetical protein